MSFRTTAEALGAARTCLARGDAHGAAQILMSIESGVHGNDARLAAELLIAAQRFDAATTLVVRIATEQTDAGPWLRHFAGHMRARGDLGASRRVLGAFVAAHPAPSRERLHADIVLALGLPAAYRDSAELATIRSEYLRNLQTFIAAYPPSVLRQIDARADDLTWNNFFLAYQGEDDVVAQTLYGDWLAASLAAVAPLPDLDASRNAHPTIAFVSGRLNESTVGWYFAAWIEYLCAHDWHVVLVHTPSASRDVLTQRLAVRCAGEVKLEPNLVSAAAQIRKLGADIVLYPELGMDSFTFALAAQRLAPVQVCAWGHPITSGLRDIDAFLTADAMEPPHAAAHYRERLIALPGIGTKYTSPPVPTRATRRDLGLPDDRPLYLVPQALYKLHPDSDRLLAEIVRRDPAALFIVFELRPPSPARLVNDRLLRALADVSTQPSRHLLWMPECPRDHYLRINQVCSVMIDTPNWSGGNASLDALHCGLAIVTQEGRFMRGRQSAAMLRFLGCEELIAESPQRLAEIAVALANDDTRRARFTELITNGLPSLTQSDAPLRALDAALRALSMS
jgi:predicted O-linked N-acetylglucosamine transferase (SPINDLY family)